MKKFFLMALLCAAAFVSNAQCVWEYVGSYPYVYREACYGPYGVYYSGRCAMDAEGSARYRCDDPGFSEISVSAISIEQLSETLVPIKLEQSPLIIDAKSLTASLKSTVTGERVMKVFLHKQNLLGDCGGWLTTVDQVEYCCSIIGSNIHCYPVRND